jgi:hypothetical protein
VFAKCFVDLIANDDLAQGLGHSLGLGSKATDPLRPPHEIRINEPSFLDGTHTDDLNRYPYGRLPTTAEPDHRVAIGSQ